jgi:hypothetical protein
LDKPDAIYYKAEKIESKVEQNNQFESVTKQAVLKFSNPILFLDEVLV